MIMDYELNMREFWAANERCLDSQAGGCRVPVSMHLDGDWICEYLKLNNAKYYSDFEYQQESRLRCGEITESELAYGIRPAVDFGVVMDASVYGGAVNYEENATPTLRPVVNDPAEIDALVERMRGVNLLEQGLIPKYLEWRAKIQSRCGFDLLYGHGMKGCATMLGQICGITNFLTWIITDPEQIHKLVACWLDTSQLYIQALRRETGFPEGETGFAFASDLAGMLSPRLYQDFIRDAEKELYEIFAPGSRDKRFYHADYHMHHLLEILKGMGVNEVNIDPYVDPHRILEIMPEVVVYGQIPPTDVLLYGTPEEVVTCAKRDIEQAGPGRHLVLCTVGSINPGTSFANLQAMCYAAEKYGYIYY